MTDKIVSVVVCALIFTVSVSTNAHGQTTKITYQRVAQDREIETQFEDGLGWLDARLSTARVNIFVYNGYSLLYGEVPEETLSQKAEQFTRGLAHVRQVFNQLQTGNNKKRKKFDELILNATVKGRLVTSKTVSASRIAYVIDGETLYLMGLLHEKEAHDTVSLVKRIPGITKVVTLFEYLQ